MPLSDAQKLLLEKCEVPDELRQLLDNWLSNSRTLKQKTSLDFLLLLSDLLQTAEKHLHAKRNELAIKTKNTSGIISPSRTSFDILALEENIKNSWQTATSLWYAVDQVVRYPEDFSINLTSKHVEYALATRNLPLLELLKWARPRFFELSPRPAYIKRITWILCGVCGAILGLLGGFLGGLREGFIKPGLHKLLFPVYGMVGMLIGWASSAVHGARLGYRTGHFFLSCKLAFVAAYMSPFHAPRGSKKQQAVQLMIEENLFRNANV